MRIALGMIVVLVLGGLLVWLLGGLEGASPEPPPVAEPSRGEDVNSPEGSPAESSPSHPVLAGHRDAVDPTKTCRLEVQIVEAEDQDMSLHLDVRIWLRFVEPERYFTSITSRTDVVGIAVVENLLAEFASPHVEVRVESARLESKPRWVRTTFDEETRTHHATVRLVRQDAVVGRVLLPPGVPASAARAWYRTPDVQVDHYGSIQGSHVPLQEDGSFYVVDSISELSVFEVTVAHAGRRWFGHVLVPEPTLNLEIPVEPLRVGDLALVFVRTLTPDGKTADGYTSFSACSPDGVTEAVDLDDCDQDEGIGLFRYQPDAFLWFEATTNEAGYGTTGVGPLSPEVTEVVVTLEPERVLRGRITTEAGDPIEGVRLKAEAIRDLPFFTYLYSFEETATSDAEGRFAFQDLTRRRYWIEASLESRAYTTAPFQVAADQHELEILMRKTVSVDLRVVDADGAPLQTVKVTAQEPPPGVPLDPDGPLWSPYVGLDGFDDVAVGHTDIKGRTVLEGLDPAGSYRLLIGRPATRPDVGTVEIQGWTPESRTFTLPTGALIRGRVVDAEGEPQERAFVRARGLEDPVAGGRRYQERDGTSWIEHPSGYVQGKSGAFALGPLPPGRYAVWTLGGDEVVAEAGDEDVVLVARPWEETVLALHVRGLPLEDRGAAVLVSVPDYRPKVRRLEPGGYVAFHHMQSAPPRDIWIAGLRDGRYVWAQGVVPPSDDWHVVELDVERGGSIEGRVAAPTGVRLDTWRVLPVGPLLRPAGSGVVHGAFPCTRDEAEGTFELTGVPPGDWTIRVEGRAGERTLVGEAQASAGQHVEIELR